MRSSVAAPTRSPGSARGITTLVPAQLAIQGGGIDAEHLGGAGLVAAFALEHPGDIGALDHVECGVRLEPLRYQGLVAPLGQLFRRRGEVDCVALAEYLGLLERVLEP